MYFLFTDFWKLAQCYIVYSIFKWILNLWRLLKCIASVLSFFFNKNNSFSVYVLFTKQRIFLFSTVLRLEYKNKYTSKMLCIVKPLCKRQAVADLSWCHSSRCNIRIFCPLVFFGANWISQSHLHLKSSEPVSTQEVWSKGMWPQATQILSTCRCRCRSQVFPKLLCFRSQCRYDPASVTNDLLEWVHNVQPYNTIWHMDLSRAVFPNPVPGGTPTVHPYLTNTNWSTDLLMS